jgi:acyl carrier protein
MSESIQERVLRVIATKQRLPLESLQPESTFEELGIDSLDRLNILFDLEGEFEIEIDDEDAKKVTNLQQMIAGIEHLVAAKGQPAPTIDA